MMLSSSKSSSDYDGKSDVANSSVTSTANQESTDGFPNEEKDDHRIDEASSSIIKLKTRYINQQQREEWAKLLDERPLTENPEAISKWINKILEVSALRECG